jgi:hypothetical protein
VRSKAARELEPPSSCPTIAGVTNQPPQNNPILTRFRVALAEMYGDRLGRAVLFGSRARGDHNPDSNYDAAVFIKDPGTLTE